MCRGLFRSGLKGTQRGNGGGDPNDERVCGGDDDREQVLVGPPDGLGRYLGGLLDLLISP